MLPIDRVRYRPIGCTGTWPAIVHGVRADGRLDIEVECGGIGEPVLLSRIDFTHQDVGRSGVCFASVADGE